MHTQACLHIRDVYKYVWESLVGVHALYARSWGSPRPALLEQAGVVGSGLNPTIAHDSFPPQCPIQPSGGTDAHEAGPRLSGFRSRPSTDVLHQGLGEQKGRPYDQGWGH